MTASTAPAPPAAEAAPRMLFARDVAALLSERTGRDIQTETITQYLWLRNKRIRRQRRALLTDIPEPADYRHPPWQLSGMLRPCWAEDGPIMAWIEGRQVPGKPRNDGQPRVRRKNRYRTPGRTPAAS